MSFRLNPIIYCSFVKVVGERIRKEVVPFVATRAGVHRAQRKQCLADLQAIHANLTGAMEHLFKAQKHYGYVSIEMVLLCGLICELLFVYHLASGFWVNFDLIHSTIQ